MFFNCFPSFRQIYPRLTSTLLRFLVHWKQQILQKQHLVAHQWTTADLLNLTFHSSCITTALFIVLRRGDSSSPNSMWNTQGAFVGFPRGLDYILSRGCICVGQGTHDRLTFSLCTASFLSEHCIGIPIEIFPINQDALHRQSPLTTRYSPFYD